MKCSICGGTEFRRSRVLWPELIAEWELDPHQADYVDRQQGEACVDCGGRLRHNVLGQAFRSLIDDGRTLREIVAAQVPVRVLDVNGAETISDTLAGLPGYTRVDYPEVDIRDMPFETDSFDVVLHSDTLEHVPNPLLALDECRRVLRPGGHVCFTIPMIVERMTRGRAGMPPSYHGDPSMDRDDFVVQTEYGADAWTHLARAGFQRIGIHVLAYPAAHAFTAMK